MAYPVLFAIDPDISGQIWQMVVSGQSWLILLKTWVVNFQTGQVWQTVVSGKSLITLLDMIGKRSDW